MNRGWLFSEAPNASGDFALSAQPSEEVQKYWAERYVSGIVISVGYR